MVSVQRVLEKKVRRLVSDWSARRSRFPIGVNVGSLRRAWYLGVFGDQSVCLSTCDLWRHRKCADSLAKERRRQGLNASCF